jgi:hypothetical protein
MDRKSACSGVSELVVDFDERAFQFPKEIAAMGIDDLTLMPN